MRVIAGALGGRRLSAPRGTETRPTTDRVREALFGILGDITGRVVLDLYAGTGALGIEALSRGAERAVFVEKARSAHRLLTQNIHALDLTARCRVLAGSVRGSRASLAKLGPYDLVLADPPYADAHDALAFVAELAAPGSRIIAPGATIVLEHAARDRIEHPELTLESTRRYGDSALSFYLSS
jgi:16S rRNA (guanine966-N2)-methyltransferase